MGISFIVLASEEPMIRKDLIIKACNFSGILFPIFMNGMKLNNDYLQLLDENRNIVTIIYLMG